MQALASLFACCNHHNSEPQVTLDLYPRPSSLDRKAHIQRSFPKHQHRASSAKHSSTFSLSTNSPHSGSVLTKRQQDVCQNSNWVIEVSHVSDSNSHGVQYHQQSRSISSKKQTLLDHIQPLSTPLSPKRPLFSQTDFSLQAEPVKPSAPRLLVDRRIRKAKAQETALTPKEASQILRQPQKARNTLIASVLETIEERLSMPSCSESQFNEINRMPSRSVFGQFNEPIDHQGQLSPRQQLSCVIHEGSDSSNNQLSLASTQSLTIKRSSQDIHHKSERGILTENYQLSQQNLQSRRRYGKGESLGEVRSRFW